jgi:hypothetical protein
MMKLHHSCITLSDVQHVTVFRWFYKYKNRSQYQRSFHKRTQHCLIGGITVGQLLRPPSAVARDWVRSSSPKPKRLETGSPGCCATVSTPGTPYTLAGSSFLGGGLILRISQGDRRRTLIILRRPPPGGGLLDLVWQQKSFLERNLQ